MQCIKTQIEWLKHIIAALTGKCIFGDAVKFINKDCRVLYFGDIFIVPFLCPALGLTAMCSPGWGNLVAIDWNDLPVGREFEGKFLKNVKPPVTGTCVRKKNVNNKEGGRECGRSLDRNSLNSNYSHFHTNP